VLNTTDGVTFTCEKIAEEISVAVATLTTEGTGCNASNVEILTRQGNATGGGYSALGPVEVFSMECSSACNSYCGKQAKYNTGFIVGRNGANAECMCIR
jgi:hypothetical protein